MSLDNQPDALDDSWSATHQKDWERRHRLASDPIVTETLVEFLQSPREEPVVRHAAAAALADIGSLLAFNQSVRDALLQTLQQNEDAPLRTLSAKTLGELGYDAGPEVAQGLLAAFPAISEENVGFRVECARAISRVVGADSGMGDDVEGVLLGPLSRDSSKEVRYWCVAALGQHVHRPKVRFALERSAEKDSEQFIREAAEAILADYEPSTQQVDDPLDLPTGGTLGVPAQPIPLSSGNYAAKKNALVAFLNQEPEHIEAGVEWSLFGGFLTGMIKRTGYEPSAERRGEQTATITPPEAAPNPTELTTLTLHRLMLKLDGGGQETLCNDPYLTLEKQGDVLLLRTGEDAADLSPDFTIAFYCSAVEEPVETVDAVDEVARLDAALFDRLRQRGVDRIVILVPEQ